MIKELALLTSTISEYARRDLFTTIADSLESDLDVVVGFQFLKNPEFYLGGKSRYLVDITYFSVSSIYAEIDNDSH